jgi:4-aminobutyrate aminotransferase-like enzyme
MMNQFVNGTYPLLFSTFGGNAVACAAGMAVLDVIERENLLEKANEVGDYLRAELHRLATRHPLIGDVRGCGMMIGLELVTDRASKTPAEQETKMLIEEMLARRVLVGSSSTNVLKLRPSLAWDKEEVDFFIQALDRSLAAVA